MQYEVYWWLKVGVWTRIQKNELLTFNMKIQHCFFGNLVVTRQMKLGCKDIHTQIFRG